MFQNIMLLHIANVNNKLQQQLKKLKDKLVNLEKQDQEYINQFEQAKDLQQKRKIMFNYHNFRNNELNVVKNTIKSIEYKMQQLQLKDQFNNTIKNIEIGDKIQINYNPSFDSDMSAAIYINNDLVTDKNFRTEQIRLSHNQLRIKYLQLNNNLLNANIDARIIFNSTIAIILSNRSNINNLQLADLIKQKINYNLLIFEQDDSVKELTRLAKKMNIFLNYLEV